MLSDAKFLTPIPVADEPRPDFKRALAGVGDPLRRRDADFVMGFTGVPFAKGQDEPFKVGDVVEYTTPDGVRRIGSLMRPHSETEWAVRVDDTTVHVVPQFELLPSLATPRHARRAELKEALGRTAGWKPRRQPERRADGTTMLTLDVGNSRVSEDQVLAYTAAQGLEAVDMSREGPLLRIVALDLPLVSPSDPSRGNRPGLDGESVEGTGFPEGKEVWADLEDQGYEFGAPVDDGDFITRAFTLPHRYLTPAGQVTATLSPDATPIAGYFEYDMHKDQMRRFVYTAEGTVEAPYSSGAGPLSTRKDYPGGLEDGDYVVKASDEVTDEYYKDYYGPYGEQLTREIKQAQAVPVKDIINGLMGAAAEDSALRGQLHNIVLSTLKRNDPARTLNKIDETIYPRLLHAALQGAEQQRKLLRLYRQYAMTPEQEPDLGSPELFAKPQPPTEDDARRYLMEHAEVFPQLAPAAQQQLIDRLLQNPPEDLVGKAPEGAQVILPQERKRRAPGKGSGQKERMTKGRQPQPEPQPQPQPQQAPPDASRQAQLDKTPAGLHNRQPPLGFQVRPRLEQVSAQDGYLCIKMTWDPEDCRGMSDGNIRQNVITWIKGIATLKEQYPDFGTLGKPRFKFFDPEAGLAELMVRSSEGRAFPIETFEVGGRDNTTDA